MAHYELNKARITALYCTNKLRPQRHCNGKCHLFRQLRKAEGGDKKVPAGAVARLKFEVLPAPGRYSLRVPSCWLLATHCYAQLPGVRYADAPIADVFRPPLLHV